MGIIVPYMEQTTASDLMLFAQVADAGSFSAAAGRAGLPKSTVSRRITVLEEQLGERLLIRTTRRLRVTEFGQQMLVHARQIAAEVDAARALGAFRQARPSGRLRVSMPADLGRTLLTGMLAAFVGLYPAISLELDLSPRHVDLVAEDFDLAVRSGPLPDDALLAARRLAVLPWGLYAAPGYLAEYGDPQSPQDLVRHACLRLLTRAGDPIAWSLRQGDVLWEQVPPGRITANAPDLALHLACAGAGIVAVPECYATPHMRTGVLRRVLSAWSLPPSTVWAVFPGRRLMPAKTRVFIDMLQTAFAGPGST